MNTDNYQNLFPQELVELIRVREAELASIKNLYQEAVGKCGHHWTDEKYDPIKVPGHNAADDPEGSTWQMGYETPCWSRRCAICGIVETTTQCREEPRKIPVFK